MGTDLHITLSLYVRGRKDSIMKCRTRPWELQGTTLSAFLILLINANAQPVKTEYN